VLAANALGIINGTGSGKFSPDGTLKRAQIAAIINRVARVMGIETDGFTHEFNDITDNYKWADTELGWPVHAGVINGVGGGRFNPGGDLTTEQAILITYRALGALK
ncbi:MAG: S-layer homology domain-containing protein, partial [Clostridia bacterium]|nr:S-layer homology domain-containing protein [Clostridia bacterium]